MGLVLSVLSPPYLSRCSSSSSRRRQPKQLKFTLFSSRFPSRETDPSCYYTSFLPRRRTRRITTKVSAVRANESDMYSVLDAIFGLGEYEVFLDRDVYRIVGPRKLTPVSVLKREKRERERTKGPTNLRWGRMSLTNKKKTCDQTERRKFCG